MNVRLENAEHREEYGETLFLYLYVAISNNNGKEYGIKSTYPDLMPSIHTHRSSSETRQSQK